MGNAEALFLVYDQKPQILKGNVLAKKPVRSHYNVGHSFFQVLDCDFLLFRAYKSGKHFHRHRIMAHAVKECMVMLLCQNRRRHKEGDLLSFLHRLECRTDSDLRLPKSYVPADQTVHNPIRFHILFHILNGTQLIIGFFKFELLFEFPLPDGIRQILISLLLLSGYIKLYQIRRDILHRAADLCLCIGPFPAA